MVLNTSPGLQLPQPYIYNSNLICYYQNVGGVNTKLKDLFHATTQVPYDIIVLTETWLHDSVKDGEIIDLNSYQIFRSDRKFTVLNYRRGGGVLLGIRHNIKAINLDVYSICNDIHKVPTIDVLLVKIFNNCRCTYICVLYIPPSCPTNSYSILFDSLMSMHELYDSDLLILGDFNIPEFIDWSHHQPSSSIHASYSSFISFFNLSQQNRVTNKMNRLLDLVLCSKQCKVSKANDLILAENDYHPALEIVVESLKSKTTKYSSTGVLEYNFRKARLHDLYNELALVNWSFLLNISDPNILVSSFNNMLYNLFNKSVPKKSPSLGAYPAWFDKNIILLIKQKHAVWR